MCVNVPSTLGIVQRFTYTRAAQVTSIGHELFNWFSHTCRCIHDCQRVL